MRLFKNLFSKLRKSHCCNKKMVPTALQADIGVTLERVRLLSGREVIIIHHIAELVPDEQVTKSHNAFDS